MSAEDWRREKDFYKASLLRSQPEGRQTRCLFYAGIGNEHLSSNPGAAMDANSFNEATNHMPSGVWAIIDTKDKRRMNERNLLLQGFDWHNISSHTRLLRFELIISSQVRQERLVRSLFMYFFPLTECLLFHQLHCFISWIRFYWYNINSGS